MNRPTALIMFGILCLWLLNMPAVFGAATLEYRTDQILIQPKAGSSRAALTTFHVAQGAKVAQAFPAVGGSQVIALPAGETVPILISKDQQSALGEFVCTAYLVHADATTPNDPKYLDGTLWGLNNYGQNGGTAH